MIKNLDYCQEIEILHIKTKKELFIIAFPSKWDKKRAKKFKYSKEALIKIIKHKKKIVEIYNESKKNERYL